MRRLVILLMLAIVLSEPDGAIEAFTKVGRKQEMNSVVAMGSGLVAVGYDWSGGDQDAAVWYWTPGQHPSSFHAPPADEEKTPPLAALLLAAPPPPRERQHHPGVTTLLYTPSAGWRGMSLGRRAGRFLREVGVWERRIRSSRRRPLFAQRTSGRHLLSRGACPGRSDHPPACGLSCSARLSRSSCRSPCRCCASIGRLAPAPVR